MRVLGYYYIPSVQRASYSCSKILNAALPQCWHVKGLLTCVCEFIPVITFKTDKLTKKENLEVSDKLNIGSICLTAFVL